MRSSFDIAIAGCGPAGLAVALFLERAGHRVRLFERFETPRPIGSGLLLQRTGLDVLADLGLDAALLRRGRRINRLFGRSVPSGRTALDVRFATAGPDLFALAIHRAALFDVLFSAARARPAIVIEPDVTIASLMHDATGKPTLVAADGRRCGPFDLVVDALGARSVLAHPAEGRGPLAFGALWASLPWPGGVFADDTLEQRYAGAHRMVGVLPIGRVREADPEQAAFFWSLRGDDVGAWRQRGLRAWKDDALRLWPETAPLLETIVDETQLTFATYFHRTLARPHGDGVAHVGDSAHAASPQLGQGANMALLDASALAAAIEHAGSIPEALALYARMRRLHVRFYQTASWLFTPFYQSRSRLLPFLRDQLAAPLSQVDVIGAWLARLVAGLAVEPIRPGHHPAILPDSFDAGGNPA